ncbi:MAG: pentapeptide repeat-containing protein [Coleofasciculus sp. C2-GNP5-27]
MGLREVDIYAGLNVMILLLVLNRYAQSEDELKDKISFNPCGQVDSFESTRLLYIISYSNSVKLDTFVNTVNQFFSNVNLSGANLSGANLSSINLSLANLTDANLGGANLSSANLCLANLTDAYLGGTNLSDISLYSANLSGIFWNEYTQWKNVQGLETAENLPEALKQLLSLYPPNPSPDAPNS